jgi:hypothetical protein
VPAGNSSNKACIVGRARRFVWAQDDSDARFIEKRLSKKLEWTRFSPVLANICRLQKRHSKMGSKPE